MFLLASSLMELSTFRALREHPGVDDKEEVKKEEKQEEKQEEKNEEKQEKEGGRKRR